MKNYLLGRANQFLIISITSDGYADELMVGACAATPEDRGLGQ